MVIGLTGGVGTGKTTILKVLKEDYGALIFCCDEYGHMALEPESPCFSRVIALFGKDIMDGAGRIDHNKLGEITYTNERKMKLLNDIIHPYVMDCLDDVIREEGRYPFLVIESAILIESGFSSACDKIWGVFTPKEVRLERLKKSRGYTEEKISNIMGRQMNEWELKSYCDETIVNDGDFKKMNEQIKKLLGTL